MKSKLLNLFLTLLLFYPVCAQVDLQIESASDQPVVDGIIDALWNTVDPVPIDYALVGGTTSGADFSAYFKTLWDEENLYLLVAVTDDSKINDSDAVWQDDAVEIYIDINNDKAGSYGADDYQVTLRWNDNTVHANNAIGTIDFKILDTSSGYNLEVAFPWSSINASDMQSGDLLGFDVHVHDDDDGGDRDNKISWYTTEDNSWQNPALFAIVQLTGEIVEVFPAEKPSVSVQRGFYEEAFDVEITSSIPGMELYYTLDGSDPKNSSTRVGGSSPMTAHIDPESSQNRGRTPGVVLRAVAIKEGYEFSDVVTKTYLFLNHLSTQTEHPGHDWPTDNVNGQEIDLLLDNEVLTDSRYAGDMRYAFQEIPSISIVTDLKNLFDRNEGIYVNAQEHGEDWERPASVELINPDGSDEFQIDAGLRIRGGYSRNDQFPKHAFRLFFRSEYGESKLDFPLFGEEGTDSFDKIDLRCSQNYSWSRGYAAEAELCTFNRDVFSRDIQKQMDKPYTRSRYYHLYLNGLYWGLFQTQERSEARFAASYFGGDADDYDVVKRADTGGIEATDGNLEAWQTIWDMCQTGFSGNENYYKIQGLDENGVRNSQLPVLVDIDNLIDYMNIIFYTGNFDAPVSAFMGNDGPNNFYAIYNRNNPDEGFKFFAHDNEHTLLMDRIGPGFGLEENRVSLATTGREWDPMRVDNFYSFHPQWLHYKLSANAEYRSRFSDRANELYRENGILSPENTAQTFIQRAFEYDTAVIAESARWGDFHTWQTYTKDDFWLPIIDRTMAEYFPYRSNIVVNQLKDEGLLSEVPTPEVRMNNTLIGSDAIEIAQGSVLSIRNVHTSGSIKYTVDGTDPRSAGGAVAASALDGGNLIDQVFLQTTILKARIYANGDWSPLKTLKVLVDVVVDGLQITEIHYHPEGDEQVDDSEYEFLELKNRGTESINLTACFMKGIQYNFEYNTIIEPGAFFVLSSNPAAFESRYGFAPDAEYDGQLDNGGERISLLSAAGDTILTVKYNDKDPWPEVADGLGFSIVPAIDDLQADWDEGVNWRASYRSGGSPGADDAGAVNVAKVLVNEVLANSEAPMVDAVELYNSESEEVNVGNWYLSDARNNPLKWQIPEGTVIPASGYLVLYEGHYNGSSLEYASNEFGSGFSLSSHGDAIYLTSADESGSLTGYQHGFNFGDSDTGITIGRHQISTGDNHFVAMEENTLPGANSLPMVGPIVISKIMYHPLDDDFEYLEIRNITGSQVDLFEASNGIPWKIDGIGFDFPASFSMAGGETVVLVESSIHPTDFRARYGIDESVRILNYPGKLDNNGEELDLKKSAPEYITDNQEVKQPYIRVDKVRFNDNADWPDADGNGNALKRLLPSLYGNDPANWTTDEPGLLIATYSLENGVFGIPYQQNIVATGGIEPYTWNVDSGVLPAGIELNSETGTIQGIAASTGNYDLTISVQDAEGNLVKTAYSFEIVENTVAQAVADRITTLINRNATIDLLANDTDEDGALAYCTFEILVQPEHGMLYLNADGTVSYLPDFNYVGNDEFEYRLNDVGGSTQAIVSIEIEGETGVESAILELRVNNSSDDAEENADGSGTYLTSSDLELPDDVDYYGEQYVGIRFNGITIPSEAKIDFAYIQFQTDEVSTDECNITIQAFDEFHTAVFTETELFSNRPRTTDVVTWVPEAWESEGEAAEKQRTPDIAELVQQVIQNPDWEAGNAIGFFFDGTGRRTAEAFDGEPEGAPLLHVEYTTVAAEPQIPVADFVIAGELRLNGTVELNAGNSYSPDERALNYYWTLEKPEGSKSEISNYYSETATFVPDLMGTYTISLTVSNGFLDSETIIKTVQVSNGSPIADAGPDQIKPAGSTILLSGIDSFDPDGEELTYNWQLLEIPAESNAVLSATEARTTSFYADAIGAYTIGLTVNDGLMDSEMDEVQVVVVENQAPVANAGEDFTVYTGETAKLNGLLSFDPEDISLAFDWVLVSKPAGSAASLSDPTLARPEIVTDQPGDYQFELQVSDGYSLSAKDNVVVTAVDNQAPIANAGEDQTIKVGEELVLDGSLSYDPEGSSLSYLWTIVTRPSESSVIISNSNQVAAGFTPDVAGQYSIRLDISDGHLSATDYVNITVEKKTYSQEWSVLSGLSFYPNPFNGIVHFNSPVAIEGEVNFELYTVAGSRVTTINHHAIVAGQNTLNFKDANLQNGIYLLYMRGDDLPAQIYRLSYQLSE